MSVSQAKCNLARLLAAENIIVEQRQVSTAFFDTETRLLVLPTFKEDLSVDVTDLMISHECAHALYTPDEGWKSGLDDLGIRKSILNVVEDARIERKIKHKYPGLRAIYSRAYRELSQMDFFGIDDIEFEELNLIDKINLHFKLGFIPGMEFTNEEQAFVDKVENVSTFDEVIQLSLEIQEYMKNHYVKENLPAIEGDIDLEDFDLDDFELEFEPSEGASPSDETEESKTPNESDSESDSKGGLPPQPADPVETEEKTIPEEELDSLTDIASTEALKSLLSDSNKQSYYVDIPSINLNNYIIDHTTIYSRLKPYEAFLDKTAFNAFKAETNPIVSYLTKEFMLKKNALGRKKSKVSKTGDINVSKLYAYKVSEDIFKKATRVPNEQSHGLVFFLDWSGSMQYYFNDTIKQLITMILFCKKLNIPFEVYAFTTSYQHEAVPGTPFFPEVVSEKQVMLNPLHLMNIFSSKMNVNQFATAANFLLNWNYNRFGMNYYHGCNVPTWFQLGNTPLNHTILLSPEVIDSFKEKNKVQIVNAIYLTDGESHQVTYRKENSYGSKHNISSSIDKVYLRNKKHKVTRKIKSGYKNETDECLSFIKEYTDFRIFGFRLVSQRDLKKESYYEDDSFMKKFRKENCVEKSKTSYDKYYYIRTNTIGDDEGLDIEGGDSVASITRKFAKSFTNKVNNRVFLKKFIEFIS